MAFGELTKSLCRNVIQDGTDDAALGAEIAPGIEFGKEARYAEQGEDVVDAFRKEAVAWETRARSAFRAME